MYKPLEMKCYSCGQTYTGSHVCPPKPIKTEYQRGYDSVAKPFTPPMKTCPTCKMSYTGFHYCPPPPIKTEYERGREAAERQYGYSGQRDFPFSGE